MIVGYFRDLFRSAWQGWSQFWFRPTDPATLAMVRIFTGLMLLYTHAVWTIELPNFFGPDAWQTQEAVETLYYGPSMDPGLAPEQLNQANITGNPPRAPSAESPPTVWKPSLWWYVDHSPLLMWLLHGFALAVFLALTVGFYSRIASVLAWVLAVSYCHRVPWALFGLDQISCMLALYLMLAPSGAAFSVDRWLKARRSSEPLPVQPSVGANLSLRLIQVHMCLIYFVAGIAKLLGNEWWEGNAMWMAFGNGEYQTLDMTWLHDWPLLLAAITHLTILWEIGYCALIWPRLLRPIMLSLAVFLHLGIGVCLGMMPFGLVMMIGNSAFVPPKFVRSLLPKSLTTSAAAKLPAPKGKKRVKPVKAST